MLLLFLSHYNLISSAVLILFIQTAFLFWIKISCFNVELLHVERTNYKLAKSGEKWCFVEILEKFLKISSIFKA